MSSRSITFRRGPFRGWTLDLFATFHGGQLVRTTVQLAAPARTGAATLSGVLTFAPGVEGFGFTRAAVDGGPERMAELLEWVVEASRAALDRRSDIDPAQRAHWQAIVDAADESRADWFAQYPGGQVPAFEVVGRFVFADDELCAVGSTR